MPLYLYLYLYPYPYPYHDTISYRFGKQILHTRLISLVEIYLKCWIKFFFFFFFLVHCLNMKLNSTTTCGPHLFYLNYGSCEPRVGCLFTKWHKNVILKLSPPWGNWKFGGFLSDLNFDHCIICHRRKSWKNRKCTHVIFIYVSQPFAFTFKSF